MTAPDAAGQLAIDLDELARLARVRDPYVCIETRQLRGVLAERDAARESERRLREAVEDAARDIRAHRTAFMPDGADHCEVAANAAFTTAAELVLDVLDQTGQETPCRCPRRLMVEHERGCPEAKDEAQW